MLEMNFLVEQKFVLPFKISKKQCLIHSFIVLNLNSGVTEKSHKRVVLFYIYWETIILQLLY